MSNSDINSNGTRTYKWVIGILVGIVLSILSFTAGGQMVAPTIRENIRRIDKNELRIEQISQGISDIKESMNKQNDKLDEIYRAMSKIGK